MELERLDIKVVGENDVSITLFLYGIGAPLALNVSPFTITITLFLYGIGAFSDSTINVPVISNYIIPIWNWSAHCQSSYTSIVYYYYIIPIWNWSFASA